MIDVLLPTQGLRMNGLIFQIHAILNQSYKDYHLWVLVDAEDKENTIARILSSVPPHSRITIVEVPDEWSGNWGHRPIKYAIEELPLEGEWLITSGDDDCIMEWALERLIENSSGVDSVIGVCIPTNRQHDNVNRVLGELIHSGYITGSCCLYKTERVKEVGYDDSTYQADWVLIEKMIQHPYKQIDSVLFVMPQSF